VSTYVKSLDEERASRKEENLKRLGNVMCFSRQGKELALRGISQVLAKKEKASH
jgi:hypothetical protein